MEFEEIGRVWREQGTGTIRRTRTENLSSALERAKRSGAARRRRFARSAWIVAVPMVLIFGYMAWRAPNLIAAAGAVVLTAVAGLVAVRYRAIGRRTSDTALPVRQALQAELGHLTDLDSFFDPYNWLMNEDRMLNLTNKGTREALVRECSKLSKSGNSNDILDGIDRAILGTHQCN